MKFNRSNFQKRSFGLSAIFSIALLSFAAGSLITARWLHLTEVRAQSDRVFELRIYHTVPGKVPALESRFRDKITPLFAAHNLTPVGFWVPEDAPASGNTFIYILAHSSREEAKKNWDAMFADPGFAEIMKSEQAEKLVNSVDSTYMLPTDFSPMK
jgi:hypothetical protein